MHDTDRSDPEAGFDELSSPAGHSDHAPQPTPIDPDSPLGRALIQDYAAFIKQRQATQGGAKYATPADLDAYTDQSSVYFAKTGAEGIKRIRELIEQANLKPGQPKDPLPNYEAFIERWTTAEQADPPEQGHADAAAQGYEPGITRERQLTKLLSPVEFEARGLGRSRYHDRLFAESRPRPTNEQFDEGWEAARLHYAAPLDAGDLRERIAGDVHRLTVLLKTDDPSMAIPLVDILKETEDDVRTMLAEAGEEVVEKQERELTPEEREAAHNYVVGLCEMNSASGWLDLLLHVAGPEWVRGAVEEQAELEKEEAE